MPLKVEAHEFFALAEPGAFKGLGSGSAEQAAAAPVKKTKPNEPCPCNSGKKYKKCCFKVSG